MADLDYLHNQILVFNGIKDAVTSLSYPVFILAGDFLGAQWARVLGQLANTLQHPPAIPLQGNSFDLFDRRRLD
jgi:hypothetical protein